jgi:hypothetical protein
MGSTNLPRISVRASLNSITVPCLSSPITLFMPLILSFRWSHKWNCISLKSQPSPFRGPHPSTLGHSLATCKLTKQTTKNCIARTAVVLGYEKISVYEPFYTRQSGGGGLCTLGSENVLPICSMGQDAQLQL